MTRNLRVFMAAFCIAGICLAGMYAFLLVDYTTREYSLSEAPAMIYAQAATPLELEIGVLGQRLTLPVNALNEAARLGQRYYTLLPRGLRLAGQAGQLAQEMWDALRSARLEEQFQQSLLG